MRDNESEDVHVTYVPASEEVVNRTSSERTCQPSRTIDDTTDCVARFSKISGVRLKSTREIVRLVPIP